jgi:hypothetical protein
MSFRNIIFTISIFLLVACEQNVSSKSISSQKINGKIISDPIMQDSLFKDLIKLTNNSVSESRLKDSIAFLLLPMQATCPACRKKTIDSIVKFKERLDENHLIVISGKGKKSIAGYFKQQNKELPIIEKNIFLDSTEQSLSSDLASTNPNIYYAYNGKVYLKVSCLPSTIKDDLRKFFERL